MGAVSCGRVEAEDDEDDVGVVEEPASDLGWRIESFMTNGGLMLVCVLG